MKRSLIISSKELSKDYIKDLESFGIIDFEEYVYTESLDVESLSRFLLSKSLVPDMILVVGKDCLKYLSTIFKVEQDTILLSENYKALPLFSLPTEEYKKLATNKFRDSLSNIGREYRKIRYNLKEVQENVKCVDIDTFIAELRTIQNLYREKKLEFFSFDLEATGIDAFKDNFRIIAYSIYNPITDNAYSVITYHPDIWTHPCKIKLFKEIFKLLNDQENDNIESIKAIIKERGLSGESNFKPFYRYYGEVLSSLEESFLIALNSSKTVQAFKDDYRDLTNELIKVLNNQKYVNSEIEKLNKVLDEVISEVPISGHNLSYDILALYSQNIGLGKIKVYEDTFALAHAYYGADPFIRKDLESLAINLCNMESQWKSEFQASKRLKPVLLGTRFDNMPIDILGPYAAYDALMSYSLISVLREKLKDYPKSTHFFLQRQYEIIEIYCYGTAVGLSINNHIFEHIHTMVSEDLTESKEILDNLPTVQRFLRDNELKEFNPNVSGRNSHKAAILFNKQYFNLTPIKVSEKTGSPSVDKEVIDNLLDMCKENPDIHEEAIKFLESLKVFAEFEKINTTYISPLHKDGKVISNYRQEFKTVGATFSNRLSSSFHVQPKHAHLKSLYSTVWNKDSNIEFTNNVPGVGFTNIPIGYMKVEYEDGTTGNITMKEAKQRNLI